MMPSEVLVPLSEAKVRFHELVRMLESRNVLLLRHGRPVGVMLAYEGYQALQERIEELEDRLSLLQAREDSDDMMVPWEKIKAEAGLHAAAPARPRKRR